MYGLLIEYSGVQSGGSEIKYSGINSNSRDAGCPGSHFTQLYTRKRITFNKLFSPSSSLSSPSLPEEERQNGAHLIIY